MSRFRTWVLLLAVLAGAPAACDQQSDGLNRALRTEDDPIEVEVAAIRRESVTASLELTGNLLPRRRSMIVSEVDAVIASIPKPRASMQVTPEQVAQLLSIGVDLEKETPRLGLGDEVLKGAVLVTLQPRDFELELASASARLKKSQADLQHLLAWKRPEEIRRLRALESEAKANLEQARSELQRAATLREKDAVTQREYDRRATEVKTKEAGVDQARAILDIAAAGPTKSAIAVARALVVQAESDVAIAAARLEKTIIRAPYDCAITELYVDIGDRVTALPRVEIMEIVDLSLVVAEVGVPERFLSRVRHGDTVMVRAEGVSSAVPGIVIYINDKVDPDTRTCRTRITVDNRHRRFKAGQFARVTFKIASSGDALTSPSVALTYADGRAQVFVYRGDRVELRPVTPGITADRQTEILSGLTEGEKVVIDDPSVLADGMTVRLRGAAAETRETDG